MHFNILKLRCHSITCHGFPGGSDTKELACNEGDPGLNPGSGRSPGEGHGYPLQYSCLENSMDRMTNTHTHTHAHTHTHTHAHTSQLGPIRLPPVATLPHDSIFLEGASLSLQDYPSKSSESSKPQPLLFIGEVMPTVPASKCLCQPEPSS